jgi:hypothetical protein
MNVAPKMKKNRATILSDRRPGRALFVFRSAFFVYRLQR